MHNEHLPSPPSHGVVSPSSSPSRVDGGAHAMLHNVDAILAHEAHTLHRLQAFYEQHTFDTQGPYADLFAVLLSSCKHVIDINAALVRHIRVHDAALQRQHATCDVLCSEVTRQKLELDALRSGRGDLPPAASTPATSPSPKSDREGHRHTSSSSEANHTRHFSAQRKRHGSRQETPEPSDETSSSEHASPHDPQNVAHSATWATTVEERLDALQHQLSELSHSQQAPPPCGAQVPVVAITSSSSSSSSESNDRHGAVAASLAEWKTSLEDKLEERLDSLAEQVTALDKSSKLQQRQLQWMGVAAGDKVNGEADRRAIARTTVEATSATAPAPPPAVTQWLHAQLDQREEAWCGVLEDVLAALTAPDDAAFDGNRDTFSSCPGLTGRPRQSAVMAHLLEQLFRYSNEAKLTASMDQLEQQRQLAEEQLHDVVARLEVLEVYAPHRHAVATAPPVLGVELEDVAVPHAGVRVRAVYQGYLADHAGLSVGDVIAGVGHHAIHARAQLYVVLAELTRDYNAQCRVKIEEGYMRHYTAAPGGVVDASIFTAQEMRCEDVAASSEFDTALHRARAEAAGAQHRNGYKAGLAFRGNGAAATSSPSSPFMYPASLQHKDMLAQCLPYFELTLHILRDGRLRDVVLLVPPVEALRSVTQY